MAEQDKNVTDVYEILFQMGITGQIQTEQFKRAEDGTDHEVWKIMDGQMRYVLKKAEKNEAAVYQTFLAQAESGVPRLHKTLHREAGDYLLMEYVDGEDLRRCDRRSLTAALDALIRLQDQFWERRELQIKGRGFEADLQSRKNRGNYLHDSDLERAYGGFLEMFAEQPRTLCHDDLLPFNILEADGRAVIIDWEYAGIMPYLTSFARLIAHGKEDPDAFFYMKETDRTFAIEYYYEHLAKEKGIAYEDYRRALDYFLLYEYCEWVMIGEKYGNTRSERYLEYFAKAKEHAKKLPKARSFHNKNSAWR